VVSLASELCAPLLSSTVARVSVVVAVSVDVVDCCEEHAARDMHSIALATIVKIFLELVFFIFNTSVFVVVISNVVLAYLPFVYVL
jgi:hypothetical protein